MSKKLILVLVLAFFFFKFNLAQAEVIINEIAWKGTPTNSNEWLELANTGTIVDISSWTIKDLTGLLNITLPDGATISGGGFYVIKRNNSDIVPFDFPTAFNGGLSDAGEKLILADSVGTPKQTLDFSGGWPDSTMTSDKTMQLINGSWASAAPTPKAQNPTPAPVASGGLVSGSDTSSSTPATTAETKTKIAEIPKIKTKITGKMLGFAGLPLSFQGTAFGFAGESLFFGKYFLNFGDGDSKEIQAIDSRQFTHTYFYPGEYIVSLDYFQNYYSDIPDASDQITIKIIPTDILISAVGDEKDFFVELRNNTDYTADLSNWILASDQKSFTIPRNTVLGIKKTIIISPKITNFSIEDKNTLKLMTPQQEIAFDYAASVVPVKTTIPSIPPPKGEVKNSSLPIGEGKGGVNSDVAITSASDNLTASAIESDAVDSKNSRTIIIFAIFIIFIGISASVVYFVRSKGGMDRHENDFKILDE